MRGLTVVRKRPAAVDSKDSVHMRSGIRTACVLDQPLGTIQIIRARDV
jgi:hypothetical protein